jgi:hypothetical protein
MPRKKTSPKSTPPRPRPRPKSRPKSIRDLQRRKVKAKDLIKIPVEVDGDNYILYSRHLSLGAARSFTDLSRMDADDPTRGPRSIDVAADFLTTHIRDEDGSELPNDEIAAIIDSLDLEFAGELATSMIEFIMGGNKGSGDNDDDDDDDNEDTSKKE